MLKGLKIALLVLLIAMFTTSCGYLVDADKAARAAEKQGYSGVRIHTSHQLAPSWFGCSDSDAAGFEATGTSALGVKVGLTICAGWPFKGVTVRTQ